MIIQIRTIATIYTGYGKTCLLLLLFQTHPAQCHRRAKRWWKWWWLRWCSQHKMQFVPIHCEIMWNLCQTHSYRNVMSADKEKARKKKIAKQSCEWINLKNRKKMKCEWVKKIKLISFSLRSFARWPFIFFLSTLCIFEFICWHSKAYITYNRSEHFYDKQLNWMPERKMQQMKLCKLPQLLTFCCCYIFN